MEFPEPLAALSPQRSHLDTLLYVLDTTDDPVGRADIASEVVDTATRYENVKSRVLYPALRRGSRNLSELDQAEEDQRVVRESLIDVRKRLRHVKPINAHADDPEGFEQSIEALSQSVRLHLNHEDRSLLPMVERLPPTAKRRLGEQLEAHATHASGDPDSSHHLLHRKLVDFEVAIERKLKDESTPWHPGIKEVERNERQVAQDR